MRFEVLKFMQNFNRKTENIFSSYNTAIIENKYNVMTCQQRTVAATEDLTLYKEWFRLSFIDV